MYLRKVCKFYELYISHIPIGYTTKEVFRENFIRVQYNIYIER